MKEAMGRREAPARIEFEKMTACSVNLNLITHFVRDSSMLGVKADVLLQIL
jgi:hypothetical protein